MASGAYRLGVAKITSATGVAYSSAALTAAAVGTLITRMRVNTGTAQQPGGTYRVAVFLYDGSTYWEHGSFDLTNSGDTAQWQDTNPNVLLPANTWSVVFVVRTPILAGAELHLIVEGQDVS